MYSKPTPTSVIYMSKMLFSFLYPWPFTRPRWR